MCEMRNSLKQVCLTSCYWQAGEIKSSLSMSSSSTTHVVWYMYNIARKTTSAFQVLFALNVYVKRKVQIGTILRLSCTSSDPSFVQAISRLSGSLHTHTTNVVHMYVQSLAHVHCMLVCVCWLENGALWDFCEVDKRNLPIWKESQKQGIVSIKQGDDRLSIKMSHMLHIS